jgi:hypothetical protein
MEKLLVEVDGDMLETIRVMLGVKSNQDAVQGALALLIAGQDERARLSIEVLATHNDAFPPHDRTEAWRAARSSFQPVMPSPTASSASAT